MILPECRIRSSAAFLISLPVVIKYSRTFTHHRTQLGVENAAANGALFSSRLGGAVLLLAEGGGGLLLALQSGGKLVQAQRVLPLERRGACKPNILRSFSSEPCELFTDRIRCCCFLKAPTSKVEQRKDAEKMLRPCY